MRASLYTRNLGTCDRQTNKRCHSDKHKCASMHTRTRTRTDRRKRLDIRAALGKTQYRNRAASEMLTSTSTAHTSPRVSRLQPSGCHRYTRAHAGTRSHTYIKLHVSRKHVSYKCQGNICQNKSQWKTSQVRRQLFHFSLSRLHKPFASLHRLITTARSSCEVSS